MRLATREQAQNLDRQSHFQISESELMENAGRAAAEWIMKSLTEDLSHVAIICGRGHNGGDGRVVAKYLSEKKISTQVIEAIPPFSLSGFSLVIDAFLGTGVSKALTPEAVSVINKINSYVGPVVSLDIPSGLDCNTGWDFGACVRASYTLTFGLAKPGLYINQGHVCAGDVTVLEIGFPPELVKSLCNSHFLFSIQEAKSILPERHSLSNKSDFGRTAVVAGSEGMWGAAILSSRAAYRSGSGYVYLLSFDDPTRAVNESPEVMMKSLDAFSDWAKTNAYVVGPGLGAGEKTVALIQKLLDLKVESVLLDADALTALSQSQVRKLPATWVLTPHSGEMSRLIPLSVEEIEFNRFRALEMAHEKWGCLILLKGLHSAFFDGKSFYIVNSGNVALAKAGSGDVLSGLIGGYMAQGMRTREATLLGAYLHGAAADLWVREYGHPSSLLASEIEGVVPEALREVEQA